jgi:murein DD-endopeptidase MepM/ murein hydrolase activator NlpD
MRNKFRAWLLTTLFLFFVALPPSISLALQKPARIGVVDILLNTPESGNGTDIDWLSGAVIRQKGRDVNKAIAPKTGSKAPHIEYADVFDMGAAGDIKGVSIPTKGTVENPLSVKGKRWIVGSKQLVKGGFGGLQCSGLMGCFEFAGRKVVNLGTDTPDEFKLVLMSIDKTEHVGIFQAYVRACIRGKKKWITCTPYSIPTGFLIPIKQNSPMPVDIAVPAFGFKLSANAAASIKGILSPQNLKNIGIQAGADIASDVVSGARSGGGNGNQANPEGGDIATCDQAYGHFKHSEANPSDLVSAPTSPSLVGSESLHKDAAAAFVRMRLAAARQSIELNVVSGFRSNRSQQVLWDNQVAKKGSESAAAKTSAPPGYSEHHTGYALDIGYGNSPDLTAQFETTPAYAWLNQNAAKYGFSQSFTRGSSQGADNEPWHWRFTGTTAAQREFSGVCGGSRSTPQLRKLTVDPRSPGIPLTQAGSGLATGKLIKPFAGDGPIVGSWGEDRGDHLHKGVDFAIPMRTPIRASDGGIAYPMEDAAYGHFIVIDHQNGTLTLYAHLDQQNIASGQRVSKGDIIGLSGSSGRSKGPHVHFEVIKGATPGNVYSGSDVNPLDYLGRQAAVPAQYYVARNVQNNIFSIARKLIEARS